MQCDKITSRIGARVSGIDLTRPLEPAEVAAIRAALDQHQVLFFTGQAQLSGAQHLRFARYFGEIPDNPFSTSASQTKGVTTLDFTDPKMSNTDAWHSDGSFHQKPPAGSILQAQTLPPVGGDTCFASMAAAYDALSAPLQQFFEGLTASHSLARMLARSTTHASYKFDASVAELPPAIHPLVTINPRTGRRRLYCNSNYTIAIDGLSKAESDHWLAFLFDHVKSPEFQVRHRWGEGDVAFWDNHAVQHYAVADYDRRRVMQRATFIADRPVGVDGSVGARQAA
jgi:taurine dioxygenase